MRNRWHRPEGGDVWIMGVLNCTPDSFSDGGIHLDPRAAVAAAITMQQAGAAIIDVGGESTRPGAATVSLAQELDRVIPVITELSGKGVAVSVDTMKAEVMHQAVAAGAVMINDVSALTADPASIEVAADCDADICLMHMQGSPETMQQNPQYGDVVDEVSRYFEARLQACAVAGIDQARLLLDPGIGFGKRLDDNLALIRATALFKQRFGLPLLLGLSRKSFLGLLTNAAVEARELETAVADTVGIMLGADLVRVHDVAQQARAVRVASALS